MHKSYLYSSTCSFRQRCVSIISRTRSVQSRERKRAQTVRKTGSIQNAGRETSHWVQSTKGVFTGASQDWPSTEHARGPDLITTSSPFRRCRRGWAEQNAKRQNVRKNGRQSKKGMIIVEVNCLTRAITHNKTCEVYCYVQWELCLFSFFVSIWTHSHIIRGCFFNFLGHGAE